VLRVVKFASFTGTSWSSSDYASTMATNIQLFCTYWRLVAIFTWVWGYYFCV